MPIQPGNQHQLLFFFCSSGKETVENLKISRGQLAPCQENRIKRQQTVSSAESKPVVPNAGFLLASMPSYCRFKPIECSYSESVSVSVPQDSSRGSAICRGGIQLGDAPRPRTHEKAACCYRATRRHFIGQIHRTAIKYRHCAFICVPLDRYPVGLCNTPKAGSRTRPAQCTSLLDPPPARFSLAYLVNAR